MAEGSIFSPIVESLQFIQSGDLFSPKNLAWIDSCLIKDAEISDSGWNSLKDALLEIFRTEPYHFSILQLKVVLLADMLTL